MSNSQCIGKSCRSQLLRLTDGKVVGRLEGNAFIKPVVGSRHMLRTPRAWAVDAEVYDEIRPGIERIVVEDTESGTRYHATAETFDRFRGSLNRGFGRQYFLPLTRWSAERPGEAKQLALNFDGCSRKSQAAEGDFSIMAVR